MTPGLRKLVLLAHITFSVGWIGAVAGFLALAITGLTSQECRDGPCRLSGGVDRALRYRSAGFRFAAERNHSITQHSVGLVPALLGGEAITYYLCHRRLAKENASDWLRRPPCRRGGIAQCSSPFNRLPTLDPCRWRHPGLGRDNHPVGVRYQPLRSPQTVGVQSMSDPDSGPPGNGLSRGLNVYLAAGIALFIVAIHISIHLANHGFHHGH